MPPRTKPPANRVPMRVVSPPSVKRRTDPQAGPSAAVPSLGRHGVADVGVGGVLLLRRPTLRA